MSKIVKVLILGGSGMLGHKLFQNLAPRFDTYATFRQSSANCAHFGIFDLSRALAGVSADDARSVERVLLEIQPEVVVNCIGIVKQDAAAKDCYTSILINSLFPHRLAQLCGASGARLIHISTDCVFSGRKGNYNECDTPDADDLYGRTKLLGEVDYDNCLTVRTSMIGRELVASHGLMEWFLGQRGKTIHGFKRAIFSGFTTNALSNILAEVISGHPGLRGVWNVAAQPISKFDLLTLVKQTYGLDIQIEPDETFACDRSLNSERFRSETDISATSWPEMIAQMHADETPYDKLRRTNATR
jgi:dTDP-4-dehydrorhamnose reductase